MFRLRSAEAIAALSQAVNEMPTDLDARSDFFVQWRARTIHTLEVLFDDDHEPVRVFKEIEFSPRRLTNHQDKDDRLKLDAYLSGCASARTHLEKLIRDLSTVPALPAAVTQSAEAQPVPRLKLDTTGGMHGALQQRLAAGDEAVEAASEAAPTRPEPYEVRPQDPPAADDEDALFQLLLRIERKLDEVLCVSCGPSDPQ